MQVPAIRAFGVHTELHRHRRIRVAAGPDRHGRPDGLEVEIGDGTLEPGQGGVETRLDDHRLGPHGFHLTPSDDAELQLRGQLEDRCVAIRCERPRRVRPDAVQRGDVVFRRIAPAAIHERTVSGLEAVGPDGHLRARTLEHRELMGELDGQVE